MPNCTFLPDWDGQRQFDRFALHGRLSYCGKGPNKNALPVNETYIIPFINIAITAGTFHGLSDGQIGLRESLTAGVGPQDLVALHVGHVGTLTFQPVFCSDRATKAVVRADQTMPSIILVFCGTQRVRAAAGGAADYLPPGFRK